MKLAITMLEKCHLKFCKYILNVKQSTPDCMVYGELGRYPLQIIIKSRIVSFWAKTIKSHNKLSNLLYNTMFTMSINDVNCNFKLISSVKSVLQETGYNYIWLSQFVPSVEWLNSNIKLVLIDQFKQKWQTDINRLSKCETYAKFKTDLSLEPYLLHLPYKQRIWITKFRTTNNRLPIETGRWLNIPKVDRLCTLCHIEIGDEFHFLLKCQSLSNLRHQILPNYFCNNPTIEKLVYLLNSNYSPLLFKLCKYIKAGLSLL